MGAQGAPRDRAAGALSQTKAQELRLLSGARPPAPRLRDPAAGGSSQPPPPRAGPARPDLPCPLLLGRGNLRGNLSGSADTRTGRSAARPPGGEPGSVASFRAACGDPVPARERAPRAAPRAGSETMGSYRSAPGRPGWAGSLFGGREAAVRPRLLPLLLVLVSSLGRGAAAEDTEVNAEVGTPAAPVRWAGGLGMEPRPQPGNWRWKARGQAPGSRDGGRGRKGAG